MLVPLLAIVLAQAPAVSGPGASLPISFQSGLLSPPLAGAPADAAVRYALARRAELGLPARATLVPGPLFSTRFGGTVRLLEQVDGLEVKGGQVIVTFDEKMRVVRLSSSVKQFDRVDLVAALNGPQALAVAAKTIDGSLLKEDGTPYGGYRPLAFVVGGALHAGYLTFVPTLTQTESWHVAVDATNGEVLFTENKVHYANEAAVYASSPGGLAEGVGRKPTISTVLPHLGNSDAGTLRGDFVRTLNCCPTANCDLTPGAPAKRATGTLQTFGGTFPYDIAVCDQRQRATNDANVHGSGDFVYTPVDPPTTQYPSNTSPADFDEFAEVNAYHHVSRTYDLVRTFSYGPLTSDGGFTPFKMRDFGQGKIPVVWVNASEPDYGSRVDGGYIGNLMYRVDNAMFVALENMAALSVPELRTDTDTLVIYQGDRGDFAYDGPVVSHEFGHGIVYSTANWDTTVSVDARSANNESSALHEGVADIMAAMTNNDPVVGGYVGPRIDPTSFAIRSVDNAYSCPTVLWGESHQDSQHFSGAFWEARTGPFNGTDQGRTFDAAFFAALVSFPPDVNFEKAANIMLSQVALAFPAMADAREKLRQIFVRRGLLECSKVVDVTTENAPREYYAMAGSAFASLNAGTAIPGPYQMKIHVPNGAKSLTISGPSTGGRNQRDGGMPTTSFKLLARASSPITFSPNSSGSTLTNDADAEGIPTFPSPGQMKATVNLAVPCGADLYFTVVNVSTRDRTLVNMAFTFEPADSCPPPVQPPPPEPDPIAVPLAPEQLGKTPAQGCGCNSTGSLLAVALLAPLFRRRRKD